MGLMISSTAFVFEEALMTDHAINTFVRELDDKALQKQIDLFEGKITNGSGPDHTGSLIDVVHILYIEQVNRKVAKWRNIQASRRV